VSNRPALPSAGSLCHGVGSAGGHKGEKGDEKRDHRGSDDDLINDGNPSVFRPDGVFGNHRKAPICGRAFLLFRGTPGWLPCGGFDFGKLRHDAKLLHQAQSVPVDIAF
jgi:hypothetical protein